MKNLIKILPLLLCIIAVQSCSDVLDNAQPSTSVPPSQALNSVGAIQGVRAGMYADLDNSVFTTAYMLAPEALADNLFQRTGANRYSGLNTNSPGGNVGGWNTYYNIINRANLIINNLPDGILDDDTKAQYRGEALFIRALAYHQLARIYSYEPGITPSTGDGSGFNMGVIIRTQTTSSTGDANYRPRKTNTEVYEQIEADLKQSITLLTQQQSGSRIYPTVGAADALLARVYLYWQKYDLADQYATEALNNTSATLATPSEVATIFDETVGLNQEGLFIFDMDPSTETVGVNNSLNVYTAEQYNAQVPTQDLIDLYSNDDARLAWFSQCFDDVASKPAPGCLASQPTIDGGSTLLELNKWDAEQGNYADDVPFIRVAELLLIQSEARLKSGSGDALAPLNKLRENRGLTDYAGTDVMQEILDERRREFIGEGQRFFDLKRLGMDIRKAPETPVQDLPFFNYKVLGQIPTSQVANSKAYAPSPDSVLVQNPGY